MASRRMFSRELLRSDKFLDLSPSAQALYIQLCLDSDDYGFIVNSNKIIRMTNASQKDLLDLEEAFVITLPSGILVIRDWFVNNYIRPDRMQESHYTEEIDMFDLDKNRRYNLRSDYRGMKIKDEDTKCQSSAGHLPDQRSSRLV